MSVNLFASLFLSVFILAAPVSSAQSLAKEAPAVSSPQVTPTGDPELEERVMTLSHTLRCLVCQNQSIAESNVPLAVDLRDQIREQFIAGQSEDAIRDYLVARYGDFVLYQPPLKASTVVLWTTPGVLLIVGFVGLAILLRRHAAEKKTALTKAEHERARALLEGQSSVSSSSSESQS